MSGEFAGLVDAIARVGATFLVHSTLLIGAALLACRLLHHRAALRSAVYRAVVVAVAALPVAGLLPLVTGNSWEVVPFPEARSVPSAPLATRVPSGPATSTGSHGAAPGPLPSGAVMPGPAQGGDDSTERQGATALPGATGDSAPAPSRGPEKALRSPRANGRRPVALAKQGTTPRMGSPTSGVTYVYAVFAVVWASGAAVLLARLAFCHIRLMRIRVRAQRVEGAGSRDELRTLSQAALVRVPAFLMSDDVQAPLLTGLFRPAIIIPKGEGPAVMAAEVHAVLVHELAHLARHDCLWNLIARILCAVAFPQPLVWVLARRMEEASDEVADDTVLCAGVPATCYARNLADWAERFTPSPHEGAAGIGVISFRSSVARRIARTLRRGRPLATRISRKMVTCVCLSAVVATALVGCVAIRRVGGEARAVIEIVEPAAEGATPDAQQVVSSVRAVLLSRAVLRDAVARLDINLAVEGDPNDGARVQRVCDRLAREIHISALDSTRIEVAYRGADPASGARLVDHLVVGLVGGERKAWRLARSKLELSHHGLVAAKAHLTEKASALREFVEAHPWLADSVAEAERRFKEAEREEEQLGLQIRRVEKQLAAAKSVSAPEKPELEVAGPAEVTREYREAKKLYEQALARFHYIDERYTQAHRRWQDAKRRRDEAKARLKEAEEAAAKARNPAEAPAEAVLRMERARRLEAELRRLDVRTPDVIKRVNTLYVLWRMAPELIAERKMLVAAHAEAQARAEAQAKADEPTRAVQAAKEVFEAECRKLTDRDSPTGLRVIQFASGDSGRPHAGWERVLATDDADAPLGLYGLQALEDWDLAPHHPAKYQEACARFAKAAALDPKAPEPHNGWGDALSSMGKYAEACGKYEQAVRLDASYAQAWFNWGVALACLEKNAEALEKLTKAVALDPAFKARVEALRGELEGNE